MLERKYRLHLQKDFDLVFKQGKYKNLPNFLTIHYLKVPENKLKVGLIISKKTEKLATKRHLAMRQSRHIIQKLIKNKIIKDSYYLLFIIRQNYTQLNFEEKEEKIREILKLGGLLSD